MLLKKNALLLFQGDSVTHWYRTGEFSDLGTGYVSMLAGLLSVRYPALGLTVLNRGVGGNRVKDLVSRWQRDCLSLRPDVVSILIGINDCWRRYDQNDPTSPEEFEAHYRAILEKTMETGAQIVLLEPFVLHHPQDRLSWREDLNPKIEVVRKLAGEFAAEYIPLDDIFQQAAALLGPAFFAEDGVHPTPAGHAIIAHEWLKLVQIDFKQSGNQTKKDKK